MGFTGLVSLEYGSAESNYRGRISAGLAAASMRATRRIDDDAGRIAEPILLMHGSADALTNPDGSRRLHERVSSRDKALVIYEGLYHEILNEPERDRVIADVLGWLDAHLDPAP